MNEKVCSKRHALEKEHVSFAELLERFQVEENPVTRTSYRNIILNRYHKALESASDASGAT